MRLAIVRQRYDPGGAVERAVEPALEALLERNVAISLVTRSAPPTRLQLVETSICDPIGVGALWRDLSFARAACRAVRRIRPTLVEAHAPLPCCDVYRACDGVHASRFAALRAAAPGAWPKAALASPYRRWLLRAERRTFASPWLRAVFCASAMVRDDVRSRFGLPEAKLFVVPEPVDGDAFHPGVAAVRDDVRRRLGVPADAVVFVAIATDGAIDGVGTAIDALVAVPAPARLAVVGPGAAIDGLRDRARARGVADRVAFARAQGDLRPWYGCADALVAASFYDPSGTTAHEALSCGLPVVASTGSGAAQRVREHGAGSVFAAGDAAALAARLHALANPAERARCAASARRAVESLSPKATTLGLVLLYRELLAGDLRASTIVPDAPRTASRTAAGGG